MRTSLEERRQKTGCLFFLFFFFEEAECASGRTSSAQAGVSPMYARQSGQRQWLSTPVAGLIKLLSNALRHVRELYRPNTSQQHLPYVHIFIPSKRRDSRIKKKCIFSRPLQKIYGFFFFAIYAVRCSLHLVVCSSPRQEVTSSPIGASSGDERVTCASRTSTTPGFSARVSPRLRQLRQQSRETQVTSMRTHLDLTVRSWPCGVNSTPTHTHTQHPPPHPQKKEKKRKKQELHS